MTAALQRLRAHAVHAYTASGVGLAFLATAELCSAAPDARKVFLFLFAAVFVDASDGPLARRWQVKVWAPAIDGRTIDDLVDYLTFTFVPLLLMWRMEWLPPTVALPVVILALITSLFGFANREAKDEADGFFLGFPSYWNVVAFYAGLAGPRGAWISAAAVVCLAVLTIVPVRFLYPNLAPYPWRTPVLAGALAWVGLLGAMLLDYPRAAGWLIWLSLAYPAFYLVLSLYLARNKSPRARVRGLG